MLVKDVRLVATIVAVGVLACFSTSEQTAAAPAQSTASAEKPIVLSKFNKRRAHTAKKSRSARYARKILIEVAGEEIRREQNCRADQRQHPNLNCRLQLRMPVLKRQSHERLAEDEARNIAALDSTDQISTVDGVQIAASDQLNDVDRALTEQSTPALVATAAAPITPPSPSPQTRSSRPCLLEKTRR